MMRVLDRLEEIIISCLMAGATLLIFVAVVHRYGTGLSINWSKLATQYGWDTLAAILLGAFKWFASWDLSWAQELCIIMFVWMAKFGAAYGVRTGVHVGVDVAINQLSKPSRMRVVLFGLMCGALFTFTIASFGARFVYNLSLTDQRTNDMEVPKWIVYLAIPLGSSLMCFRFLQVAWTFSRTGQLPHTDETRVAGVEPDGVEPDGAHAAVGSPGAPGELRGAR